MSKPATKLKKESGSSSEVISRPWTPERHHKLGVEALLKIANCGLLLDPGLGKTSITLKAIAKLKQEGMLKRALVIAPLRPCYMVWPAERELWTDFHGLRMDILHGPKKDAAIARDADIYVINPDGLPWLMSEGRFQKLNPDTLVIDESSKFKHSKTQRFKQLKPHLTKFRRRWILTGSPNPNGYEDLFGQIYILDLGRALGQYISHYRFEFFYPTGYGGYTWLLKAGAEELIQKRIKPLVLRLEAEDYIKMPKLRMNIIRVDLPDKARKIYDEMEEEMFTTMDGGKEVTAMNTAAASTKCRQIANGGLFYSEYQQALLRGDTIAAAQSFGKRTFTQLHDAKTEALQDLIDELGGAPLLIAYDFEHDLDRLLNALGKNTPYIGGGVSIKRSLEIERDWNAGKIRNLLGHPAAMGHGLNLQKAGHHVCFYAQTWDYELWDQFVRRVRRSGNKFSNVTAHHIVARNTVDEAMLKSIKSKGKTQKGFLDALKEYRRDRRK